MKLQLALASVAAAGLIAGAARAEELNFFYLSPVSLFTFEANWHQSSTSVPVSSDPGGSIVMSVMGVDLLLIDGLFHSTSSTITDVTFFSAAEGGGFSDGTVLGVGAGGPQLFTGPASAPVFTPGEYDLDNGGRLGIGVTTDAIPEPASWTMMLLGFAVLGLAGYKRMQKVVA